MDKRSPKLANKSELLGEISLTKLIPFKTSRNSFTRVRTWAITWDCPVTGIKCLIILSQTNMSTQVCQVCSHPSQKYHDSSFAVYHDNGCKFGFDATYGCDTTDPSVKSLKRHCSTTETNEIEIETKKSKIEIPKSFS